MARRPTALARGLKRRSGTLHADFVFDGRRVRKSLGTADPRLAEAMLGDLRAAAYRGCLVPTGTADMSVGRAFDRAVAGEWLAQAREATVRAALHHFKRLTIGAGAPLSASTPVSALDSARIASLRRSLVDSGLSPGTINLRMWVLRATLEAAVDAGALPTLPAMPTALSTRHRGRQRYLTPADEARVLEHLGQDARYTDLHDLWVIMLDTGMRVNEAATLKVTDVDARQGTLRVRPEVDKAGRGRVVPMTSRVAGVVSRRAGAASDQLFPAPTGHARYWPKRFHALWSEARKALGMHDVVLHTARHTTGTRLFEAGMDLRTAMEYLGHSTPEMTLGYAKAVAGKMKMAAGALEQLIAKEGSSNG